MSANPTPDTALLLVADLRFLLTDHARLARRVEELEAAVGPMARWISDRQRHTYFCGQGNAGDDSPCSCGYEEIVVIARAAISHPAKDDVCEL